MYSSYVVHVYHGIAILQYTPTRVPGDVVRIIADRGDPCACPYCNRGTNFGLCPGGDDLADYLISVVLPMHVSQYRNTCIAIFLFAAERPTASLTDATLT